MDKFQERYLAHQERKKNTLNTGAESKPFAEYTSDELDGACKMLRERKSRRIFTGGKVSQDEIDVILSYAKTAPSSCNRKAIEFVESKKGIETLVGGKGWIEKADKVLLVYANMQAYKSPNEVDFMPYLDAGFACQNVYLICELIKVACCFVNPNRTDNTLDREGYRLCGAIALGK